MGGGGGWEVVEGERGGSGRWTAIEEPGRITCCEGDCGDGNGDGDLPERKELDQVWLQLFESVLCKVCRCIIQNIKLLGPY